jgi:hypothetical protein
LVRKLLYHEASQQRVIMRNSYKISLLVLTSFASLPAFAFAGVPEVDGSVALQLLVMAGGIVALLKKKKNDRK